MSLWASAPTYGTLLHRQVIRRCMVLAYVQHGSNTVVRQGEGVITRLSAEIAR